MNMHYNSTHKKPERSQLTKGLHTISNSTHSHFEDSQEGQQASLASVVLQICGNSHSMGLRKRCVLHRKKVWIPRDGLASMTVPASSPRKIQQRSNLRTTERTDFFISKPVLFRTKIAALCRLGTTKTAILCLNSAADYLDYYRKYGTFVCYQALQSNIVPMIVEGQNTYLAAVKKAISAT